MTKNSNKIFLEFSDTMKGFDGLTVFENLSFTLNHGSIYGLVGPNACGKTTLLHSAMGLIRLNQGTVNYHGKNITHCNTHTIARLGLGIVLQNVGIFHRISVLENVLTGLVARNCWVKTRKPEFENKAMVDSVEEQARWILSKVGLKGHENKLAGSLVFGEQKQLAMARTLFASRDMLLDEPVSGMDRKTRNLLRIIIRGFAKEGRSALIVEHDLDFVLEVCDEIMFLKNGRIITQGPPSTLMSDREFQNFYGSLKVRGGTNG